uniref:Uncharacterized protein n=1 Tax=Arundo donax TaxID=35708 RepID=A0A0A9SM47_ARUDO
MPSTILQNLNLKCTMYKKKQKRQILLGGKLNQTKLFGRVN